MSTPRENMRDPEQRLHDLTPERKRLLHRRLRDHAARRAAASPGGRLVAVVVNADGMRAESSALRDYCKRKLPSYMVPQVFATVETLPRTPAGKIDRRALRAQCWTVEKAEHPPREQPGATGSAIESQLAGIWANVLGFDEINVDDNFFEVGGDSLLTIRILSRAAKAGLAITPAEFFANPTIAEQARLVEASTAAAAKAGPSSGDYPLLPIQHWFFRQIRTDPQHWNQSMLFELETGTRAEHVARAFSELLQHHDALRSRFAFADGRWTASVENAVPTPNVRKVDSSGLDDTAAAVKIASIAGSLNGDFDLAAAPLLRLALFDRGPDRSAQLLVVIHHLVIDAESWRILVADLGTLLEQLKAGKPLALPAKTTGLVDWAGRLAEYAASAPVSDQRSYWQAALAASRTPLPADTKDLPANNEAAGETVSFGLGSEPTGALMQAARERWRASMFAVLLSGVARAIAEWAGGSTVGIDIEGHGRESLFDGVDLSRSVAWFTSVFPLALDAGDEAAWRDPQAALRLAKAALRALPHNGLSFGLLHEPGAGLAQDTLGRPYGSAVLFNYLGRTDAANDEDPAVRLLDANCGPVRSARCERAYIIEINARITDGSLLADVRFNRDLYSRATIDGLAQRIIGALQELLTAVDDDATVSPVASDFGLDQQDFDAVAAQLRDLDGE